MAYILDICDAPVTAHAWNGDGSLLALCPNTSDLQIYKVANQKAELIDTLTDHTQVIMSVDWHAGTNRIVTCSSDRNAFVYTSEQKDGKSTWVPQLVVLRLTRAAVSVRWSPDGETFIVGTGHNKVRLCGFKTKQNFWSSKTLDAKHSTQLTVEFTPDGKHYIVATTGRTFLYCAISEDEWVEKAKPGDKGDDKKKKSISPILQSFQAQGMVLAGAVSPDESWYAYTSQDSYIRFIKKEELSAKDAPTHALNINGLPLIQIAFINDHTLVGAGFDSQPRIFFRTGDDWADLGLADKPEVRGAATGPAKGGMASKAAMFGEKKPAATGDKSGLHYNIIVGLRLKKDAFTTCANDGRVVVWPFEAVAKAFPDKSLF